MPQAVGQKILYHNQGNESTRNLHQQPLLVVGQRNGRQVARVRYVHQGFALPPAREKPGVLCLWQQPPPCFDRGRFYFNRGLWHFIHVGKFSVEPIQQHGYFLDFINAGPICDSLVEHRPLSKSVCTRKYSVAIFTFQLNFLTRRTLDFFNAKNAEFRKGCRPFL